MKLPPFQQPAGHGWKHRIRFFGSQGEKEARGEDLVDCAENHEVELKNGEGFNIDAKKGKQPERACSLFNEVLELQSSAVACRLIPTGVERGSAERVFGRRAGDVYLSEWAPLGRRWPTPSSPSAGWPSTRWLPGIREELLPWGRGWDTVLRVLGGGSSPHQPPFDLG